MTAGPEAAQGTLPPARRLPLDLPLVLSPQDEEYFKKQIGIQDSAELQAHIRRVQAEGYDAWPYPCIRGFSFLRFKTALHPAYAKVIAQKDDKEAFFLDLGCCFGTDLRRLAADGYPPHLLIGGDLIPEFIEIGFKLFKDDPEDRDTPTFFVGDIFSKDYFDRNSPEGEFTNVDLRQISHSSLTPFKHRIRFLHTSAVFHLFDEDRQFELASICASLIIPKSGSIIFGSHLGNTVKGVVQRQAAEGGEQGRAMFCHSPESFAQLWQDVFGADKVQLQVRLFDSHHAKAALEGTDVLTNQVLVWSVILL